MNESLFDVPDQIDLIVDKLQETPSWPRDDVKDRAYVAGLIASFPRLNLIGEIEKWQKHKITQERMLKKEARPRAGLRTWLRIARGDFRNDVRSRHRTAAANGGSGGASNAPGRFVGVETSQTYGRW